MNSRGRETSRASPAARSAPAIVIDKRYVDRISRDDANLVTEINRDGYSERTGLFLQHAKTQRDRVASD